MALNMFGPLGTVFLYTALFPEGCWGQAAGYQPRPQAGG